MVRTAYALGAIPSCATVSTSLACTPAPDSRPSSELRELQLADRSPGPAIVYPATYEYEIRVRPEALLELAVLLESGRAAIVEKPSGTAVTAVISLTFRESCFRTQRFIAPNGTIIMQIDS